MLQVQFIRSNTFRWALAVAAVLAVFIIALFGFIYVKIDHYLIDRSDRMIMTQADFIASLSPEHRPRAIQDHLDQDSRKVQFAGLFDPAGNALAGNLERVPEALRVNAPAQSVKATPNRGEAVDPIIRAVGRRLPNGDALVIGRNVDETAEISHVVGEALALGLLPALCLCLLAGAWLSLRAQRRVDDVNQRVQRIIAGNLCERLPYRNVDEPFSRLAIIVNGMLDEMETMIRALSGVGNDIAHDLRTPLTRARLTLERGRTNAGTVEQLQQVVDKAIAGIDQSLAIITSLLRLAEIENSRRSAAFGSVALHEMLREVCDVYEPIAEDKRIKLSVQIAGQLEVRGDRDLLFEAVTNLVDNAIKFTPAGGDVEIGLARGDGQTIVRISDTGPGIDRRETEAVLRRFYRSDKIRNTPGFGLGLNLVSAIVTLHEFQLVIHPGPGGCVEINCSDRSQD